MAQIAGKWISDGAITASKIDTSSTFTFQGLRVTQDASVIGDLTVNGTIALPNATINKYLYVNAGHVVEYVDATGGGASAHGVTLNTAPVAQDTTGWRNSAFSMSADDSTAYVSTDKVIEVNADLAKITMTGIHVDNYRSKIESIVTLPVGGSGSDQTSAIIIEGSPYTSSTVEIKTGISDTTHLSTIFLDSGIGHGSNDDRATILLQTGDAAVTLAQRNPYELSYARIDGGTGGLLYLKASSSYINSKGGQVDIIAGTTDTSHTRILLNGASGTSNSIAMYIDSDRTRGGSFTLQAGYLGGLDDVPIELLTDNAMTLGRAVGTNSNVSTLQANFGGAVTIKSYTSSLSLYGYEGITMSTPKLGAVTLITGDASVVKNLHVDGDIYTTQFTEYTDSSVDGFSPAPTQHIWYSKVGKQIHCWFNVYGTSNSGTFTFTLPYAASGVAAPINFRSLATISNDSTLVFGSYTLSDSTVFLAKNLSGDPFTSSGSKSAEGYLTYLTA
jgi:hypothetical protein